MMFHNGPSNRKSVLVFDWDDTICPSTFVDQHQIENFDELPPHFQKLFDELGKCAEKCLAEASKYGEVIIITNSDDGWVKYSAEKFVPILLPVIERYRIVSARTSYEHFYPSQPLCWKAAAFAHEVNEIYGLESDDKMDCSLDSTDVSSDEETNSEGEGESQPYFARQIISFGDGMEERTAVRIVSGQLSAMSKSVMFVSSPSPMQIIGQLNIVRKHMRHVCEHSTVLDLEISASQAQRGAEKYLEGSKFLLQQQYHHHQWNSKNVGRTSEYQSVPFDRAA